MAEFAALAPVAMDAFKQAQDMAKEVRDSLARNWTQGQLDTSGFPNKMEFPGAAELGDDDAAFKWTQEKTIKYQSAYFTHIRWTTKEQKQHADNAFRELAVRDATGSKEKKKIQSDIEKKTIDRLKATYTTKHKDKAATFATTAELAGWHRKHEKRYGIKLKNTTTDAEFGELVAKSIVKKRKKDRYQTRYANAHSTALKERAAQTLKDGGAKPAEIESKLQRVVQADIMGRPQRSVVICYQISYQVLKINQVEALKRWDEAVEERLAKFDEDLAKNREELRKTKSDLEDFAKMGNKVAAARLVKSAEDDLDLLADQKATIQAARKRKREDFEQRKPELISFMDGRRRIGGVAICPVASTQKLESKIHYLNTNARMGAQVAFQPDGTVVITITFHEDGATGLPGADKIFDQNQNGKGQLWFDTKGFLKHDNSKIGMRFESEKELVP